MRTLLVSTVVVSLALSAAPASARSSTWTDRADDVTGVPYLDLRSAKVTNTKKAVKVTYSTRSLGNLYGTEGLLLDTHPKRPGPELQIGFGRYSESWVIPMRRWKPDRSKAAKRRWNWTMQGKPGKCDRTVRINSRWQKGFTPVTITVRKKKGCLASKRVRIHLGTATDTFSDHRTSDPFGRVVRDQLPNGKRTFTRWVRQRKKATRFVDGTDPVRWWSDIRAVSVDHTTDRLTVNVRHLARPVDRHGAVEVHLDTDGDAVPDWLARVDSASTELFPATGWGSYGPAAACAVDGRLAPVGRTVSTISLPTAPCLGDPGSVRVAVTTTDLTHRGHRPTDWWGGVRHWSPAVARG